MASELNGTRVAFLTANEGVEQAELTVPWQAVKDAGGTPELIAPQAGEVQGFDHVDKADTFQVHRTLSEADPGDYSAPSASTARIIRDGSSGCAAAKSTR